MSARGSYDAVIVGAGVIGCAIALELARRGYRTLNVDRLPAAGYGPTSSSSAVVRLHYSSLQGTALAYEAYHDWKRWGEYVGGVDELGPARLVETGIVILKAEGIPLGQVVEHLGALGIAYEDWETSELARRCPLYEVGSFAPPKRPDDPAFGDPPSAPLGGAIFTPQGGYVVDPLLATHNLQRAAEAAGGEFLFRSNVVEIRRDGDAVRGVVLEDGTEIAAPVVVNAAGAYSAAVNRLAGVEGDMAIHTRPLRHEVHVVPAPPGWDVTRDGFTTADADLGVYFRPEGDDHILVGSHDPACDAREWLDDPEALDRAVTRPQWEAQVYRLARRIPTLPIPNEPKGLADLYDVSDDWIPIYDRSSLPGFYMAIGTSGNQFKAAPAVGRLMAELIDRVQAGRDHDADPVRVPCRHFDFELDAGFYSRRREIVSSSSFTVAG